MVSDEQKIDEYFKTINGFKKNKLVMLILSNLFGYEDIGESVWSFYQAPQGWSRDNTLLYRLQYYVINRNGYMKCHYKSTEFDYLSDELYKPAKVLTKEDVFANLERTIELLNNSKFVTLLERLYNSKGFREAVQFDKKRLLKKCGLEK